MYSVFLCDVSAEKTSQEEEKRQVVRRETVVVIIIHDASSGEDFISVILRDFEII